MPDKRAEIGRADGWSIIALDLNCPVLVDQAACRFRYEDSVGGLLLSRFRKGNYPAMLDGANVVIERVRDESPKGEDSRAEASA